MLIIEEDSLQKQGRINYVWHMCKLRREQTCLMTRRLVIDSIKLKFSYYSLGVLLKKNYR